MKKLKKIVLKVPSDPNIKFFSLLEKFELLQVHRCDDGHISVTQKVKFKDNKMHPKMLEGKKGYGMSYVEVIEEDTRKNEYIFFSKHKWFEEAKDFFKKLDVIIDPPIILDQDRFLVSIIIESKYIDEFIETLEEFYQGNLEILSISQLHLNNKNIFLSLTDRQKEIVYYAVQHGYFELPRKIDSKTIAKKFKISQSAINEHLRKIDRTIYHSFFN